MPRKKGKKTPQQSSDAPARVIPGLTLPSSSSSRSTGPISAGGGRQEPREQASVPVPLPRQKQTKPSDPAESNVPGGSRMHTDPCSSQEQRPSSSEASDSELSRHFRDLVVAPVLPRKPTQPGINGQRISLISNCYPLRFDGCLVFHYDIEVIRIGTNYTTADSGSSSDAAKYKDDRKKYRCLNTKLNRKVFKKLCSKNLHGSLAVYDGERNVYSMKELPLGDEGKFEVRIEAENQGESNDPRGPRMDIFEIIMKEVVKKETGDNVISLEPLNALFRGQTTTVPLEAVMVLETVLRYVPCLRFVPVGRNFFSTPTYANPLGNGKEVWFGHHQSVRLGQKTAVVNLNTSASSFYENIPVVEYIEKLMNNRLDQVFREEKQIKKISVDLSNLFVETTHLPYRRKYRIGGLSKKSANELKIKLTENNREIETTVERYFRTRYNVRLRYPHFPCLKVKNKDSFLPMEVCEIVKGQHSSQALNPRQQTEMIKYTCKHPEQRFQEIEEIRRKCNFDNDPYLQSFGLKVLDKPLRVDGRTMETPNVLYNGGNIRERPRFGTWNMMNKQFFTGTRINKWTLLSFADSNVCHQGKLNQFANALHKFANEQGVEMSKCSRIEIAGAQLQGVRDCINKMKSNFQAEMIFIVLPIDKKGQAKFSQDLYSEVKRVAETSIKIVTQCVKGENVISKGTNASFVSNLCLKMNAKMGGVNSSMVPAEVSVHSGEHILFVGADVNHPAPTDKTDYSLSAVVGNLDTHPSRYAVIVRPQKNDRNFKKMVEVIFHMEEMMTEILVANRKATGKNPKKIIIYRDGVSDGQFSEVQEKEIKSIRDACSRFERGYKPGITYIVVQKRHNVRFLPERRMENPPPGTVVDTTVTHPLNFDFFLYSHKGIKGTSRPSYYTVLADDNKFGFDALEKMTYSLCYTYVRCTKSISLPAPVQYADLAAYRARRHLTSHLMDMEARGKIERQEDGKFPIAIEKVKEIIDVGDYMKDSMYYV